MRNAELNNKDAKTRRGAVRARRLSRKWRRERVGGARCGAGRRRYATTHAPGDRARGLKPTATGMASLRDLPRDVGRLCPFLLGRRPKPLKRLGSGARFYHPASAGW